MKNISKNLVVAGLGLAIIASGSVFAEGSKTLSDNNSLFGGNLVKEASLRDNYLDYKNLPQGEYNVKMTIMNAKKKKAHLPSMMNDAVADSRVVVDSHGDYYLHITMKKIKHTAILGGKKFTKEGYLDKLSYYDKDGVLINLKPISFQIDAETGTEHPKEFSIPINRPTQEIQKIRIQIFAQVMEDLKKGMGTQDAIPTINWSDFSVR